MNRYLLSHILSGIAGALMVAQFILMFFFSIDGILFLKITGYALWLFTVVLGWLPIRTFRKYGGVEKGQSYMKTTTLVTRGIYSIVRHPQYLALPLIGISLMLISQHWIVILLGVPATILACLSSLGADEAGIEKFGAAYEAYMKEVPGMNIVAGLWRRITRRTHVNKGKKHET
ncbi:MAG: isoprenylcysteine carboxylmethyltransferase family protein [Spirochaetales bacterium]|nr:isoprenylcysteine carboxylmethyltransferase family protein [Spirochaetales bacterium]